MSKRILSTLIVGTALALSATAHAASTNVFTGVDVGHNSWYAYAGGDTGLQHQDILSQPGFMARIQGGYGQYNYDKPGTGNIDGDVGNASLMLGYGSNFSNGRVSAYAGVDWLSHNLSPDDPLADADGNRLGAKVQLELYVQPTNHVEGSALGAYSTAFRTYWSHFNVGYNFGPASIGPEIGFMGNDDYNAIRYGAEVGSLDLGFATASLHGGWSNSSRSGGDGGYGAVNFFKNF